MESLQVPRPAWMTEDLVLLEEQARLLRSELVPHVEKWTVDGIMEPRPGTSSGRPGCCAPESGIRRRGRQLRA